MERKTYFKNRLLFLFISISLILINPILLEGYSDLYAQETPSVSLLDKGKKLLEEKKIDDALKVFEEAILQTPNEPMLYYYAGVAYHLKRQPQQALAKLGKALELSPGMPEAIYRIGIIFEDVRRFDKAIEAFQAVTASKADPGIIKDAEERLRRLNIIVHFRNSGKLFQEKKYAEALAELQIVLSLSPDHVDAHFASGMSLQRLGKLKEAVDEFKKVVELNPAHPDALYQAALTYEALSAYEDAITAFQQIISTSKGTPRAAEAEIKIEENTKKLSSRKHFEKSADLMRKENWAEALKEIQEVIAVEPKNPNALFNLGVILHQLKDYNPAIDALKLAIEVDPKFQKAVLQLGVTYDDLGQFKDAVIYYQQVITIDEKTSEAEKAKERLDLLKYITESEEKAKSTVELLKKKDTAGAIKETEALLLVRRDDPKLYYTLAVLYMSAGRLKDAGVVLEKALILSPKDIEMRFLLGQIYEGLKDYAKSAEAYKEVAFSEGEGTTRGKESGAKARTMLIRSHFEKGKVYMKNGNYESAMTEIQAVLDVTPDDPIALFNLGVVYDRLNKPDEAMTPLEKAVSVAPEYTTAYLQLGFVYEKLRKFAEARNAYAKVLTLQKIGREMEAAKVRLSFLTEYETLTARLEKGIKLMETNDLDGARKEIEAAIALNAQNFLGYYYLGVILVKANIYDEAKAAFKKAIEINPKYLRAYNALGDILVKKEEFREARDYYQKVISLGPDTPEAEAAEVRLKGLKAWWLSFSTSQSYNTNIAFRSRAQADFSSNYNMGFTYILIRRPGWSLSSRVSANENVYFKTQLKGDGYSYSLDGDYQLTSTKRLSSNISYNKSLFQGRPTYVGTRYSINASTEPRTIPTSASIGYSGSRGLSLLNKAGNSEQHNFSISVSQKLSVKDSLSGSYSFNIYKNLDLLGSNYAYRSHGISISYGRTLFPFLGVNLGYSYSIVNYSNPDSTTLFQQLRTNTSQSVSSSFHLTLAEDISLSLGYSFSYAISKTNLPPPTAEEQQKLEEILSAQIPTVGGGGGYFQHALSVSFSKTF